MMAEKLQHDRQKRENYSGKCKVISPILADSRRYQGGHYRPKGAGKGNVEHHYSYSTLYRSKLNGDKKSKVYSSDADISKIEVVKHNNKHYVILLAGQKLVKIQIGKTTKTHVIADNVTSVAIPETKQKNSIGSTFDWNGFVYYTTAKTDPDNSDVTGTHIYRVSIDEVEGEKIDTFGEKEELVKKL